MKRINDQNNLLYIVKLKNDKKTRFWFLNEDIIEELFKSYDIPFEKIEPNKYYDWNKKDISDYWNNKD